MANWPTSFDSPVLGLTTPATLAGPPTHEQIHEQNAEILAALEAELGLNPSGADATVVARLDRIDRATASVVTSQGTSSTAYTDLATVGPSVTLVTGRLVRVTIVADISATASDNASVSLAVSGASAIAAPIPQALTDLGGNFELLSFTTSPTARVGSAVIIVTAGTNTFTMKYKATDSGGGGVTGTFANRLLVVQRLD